MALIQTIKGEIDESLLTFKEGSIDNDVERTFWQEWWLGDELVRRDAQVNLKQGIPVDIFGGQFA